MFVILYNKSIKTKAAVILSDSAGMCCFCFCSHGSFLRKASDEDVSEFVSVMRNSRFKQGRQAVCRVARKTLSQSWRVWVV